LSQWDATFATLSHETQTRNLLNRLDENDDGQLMWREIANEEEFAGSFRRLDTDANGAWDRDEIIAWCRRSRAGEVSLGQIISLASQGLGLAPGEMRLLGWTDRELTGVTTRPAVSQAIRRALFVVHLRRGVPPTALPDVNRMADYLDVTEEADEDQIQNQDATAPDETGTTQEGSSESQQIP
jgi:hypothetical protein